MGKIVNLTSERRGDNVVITPNNDARSFLSYLRNKINLMNERDRKEFVVGTERIIRDSKDYSRFIKELKETIPFTNRCALYNHITDEDAKIEMHHGPIFTLAELVTIVLNHKLKNNESVNSFLIAQEILEDHFDGIVQVIFLSEMAHKVTSNKQSSKNAFIPIDHAIGDVVGFIKKYNDAITYYEVNKIRNYLYMSELYGKSGSVSVYDYLKERVKSFKNNIPKEDN